MLRTKMTRRTTTTPKEGETTMMARKYAVTKKTLKTKKAPKARPLPSAVKVIAKPTVSHGLVLTTNPIEKTFEYMSEELLSRTVAVGRVYEDARKVKGNWHSKPTRDFPAILFEASDQLAAYIHNHAGRFEGVYIRSNANVADRNSARSMVVTWDEDRPKRMLAYGLFAKKILMQMLDELKFDSFARDFEEQRDFDIEIYDAQADMDEAYREQGFYGGFPEDAARSLRRHWRYPQFHEAELDRLEEIIAQYDDNDE